MPDGFVPRREERPVARNVLGGVLLPCSVAPLTGWFRDGCCNTDVGDRGLHVICVEMTAPFLEFSRDAGNDLSTPQPEYEFPGLNPGDRWCLGAVRWEQARQAGRAPKVILNATHEAALQVSSLSDMQANSAK
ncbi:MAG: hypothetical protein JWR10_3271 [Rubritepida sp.]|nr:hypothetical protein [Rubritepida sp.]